ncbi:DUF3466 family protein [Aquisphaera giovannonii]|uniref:DUF3466 family protein n=1 Tax=Aquisphaera giovannonii TaxID=406548 RepID=UPI0011DF3685
MTGTLREQKATDSEATHRRPLFYGISHPLSRRLPLGTLPGTESIAYAINSSGQVVGTLTGPGGSDAFLWSNGKMADLGVLPGESNCVATSINDSGQIVGTASPALGGSVGGLSSSRAFLYMGGKLTDLNDLLPPDSGWVLTSATSINNKGVVVGLGSYNGAIHGYELTTSLRTSTTPIPTPTPGPTPTPAPAPTPTPNPTPSPAPGQPTGSAGSLPPAPPAARAPRFATRIVIRRLSQPVAPGRSIALVATVGVIGSRRRVAGGILSLAEGDGVLVEAPINRGRAVLRLTTRPAGGDPIRIDYSGSQEFAPTSSDILLGPPRVRRHADSSPSRGR